MRPTVHDVRRQNRPRSPETSQSARRYPAFRRALFVSVNPGNTLTGKLVFDDIPAGAALTKIELHDSPFSGGVAVALS